MTLEEVRKKYPGAYDDMSDEDLAKALHTKFYSDMPYADFAQKVGIQKPKPKSWKENVLSHYGEGLREATQFAVGAGKGAVGAADFLINNPYNKFMDEKLRPGQKRVGDAIFDPLKHTFKETDKAIGTSAANVAGEALSPANLALGPLLRGAGFWKQVGGGAATGALAGQMQLDESDVVADTATGAGIGALFGSLGYAGKAAKDIYNTFAPGKPTHLAKQLLEDSVGKKNVPIVLKELEAQLARGSVTPYQKTTTEMLSHLPEANPLISLQKQIAKGDGGTSSDYLKRWKDQQGAIETIESLLPKSKRRMSAAERAMSMELEDILKGRKAVQNPLQPTKVRTVEQVAAEAAPSKFVPQMLYSPFTLSRWVLNKFGKNQEQVAHEIEDVLKVADLDPRAFQEIFKHMTPEQAAKVSKALEAAKLGAIGFSTQD